ncbi:MAG: hypothetical protein HOP31_15675 [Ignavibacteria bacterium]|nr:hypothetical protein [Ignavibacteria bacterium]
MFTIQYRQEVRQRLINNAKNDSRIVSAAIIGSYAHGKEDRWSDIDLTFGVAESTSISSMIDSWTDLISNEFDGITLFDVKRENTIYRVFILPGCLQVDLSFSPVSEFGAVGPHFKLLYGNQYEKAQPRSLPIQELFGYMVHHILRARFCMERNRLWQAEFWISEARNYALKLACQSRGLNIDYGRGFDDLPQNILDLFKDSFVKKLNKKEIIRSIQAIISGLEGISEEVKELSVKLNHIMYELSLCDNNIIAGT